MYVMLDYETLGNGADTIVLSLGAVYFNRDGIHHEKLFHFNLRDQVSNKRTFTASTLIWWMGQKEGAREVFKKLGDDALTIENFFLEFETESELAMKKVNETWDQFKPIGNGANFDISILEDIYRRHHGKRDEGIPWKFWNVICYRTFNLLTDCKKLLARPHGTHHSALDDARYQANTVLAYWKAQDAKKAARGK